MKSSETHRRGGSNASSTASLSPPSKAVNATKRLSGGFYPSKSPHSDALSKLPGSPNRTQSPGLGLIFDRESYWQVTLESGCVPALHFALDYDKESGENVWWGGRFKGSLAPFEDLVEQLPVVLASQEQDEIHKRVHALPHLELFASQAQKSTMDTEDARFTGRGHSETCPALRSSSSSTRATVILHTDVERERAFALFAFIANAYVFAQPKDSSTSAAGIDLPAQIAVPLTRLAAGLGRRGITDYACSVLNNWILKDPKGPFSLENIHVPRTFTGLDAERWFFAVHAVIEHHGGRALVNMLQAKETITEILMVRKLHGLGEGANKRAVALQRLLGHSKSFSVSSSSSAKDLPAQEVSDFDKLAAEKTATVVRNLQELARSLEDICDTMKRLPDNCPADVFFDKIRPWVSSWPDPGVVYQTYCTCPVEHGKQLPEKLSGASGAQSSLLPSIDGFLGIAYGHRQNVDSTPEVARTDLGAFIRQLKSFRLSMPLQHRDLVARFESQGNISELVAALDEHLLKSLGGPSHDALDQQVIQLKSQYNNCIELLTAFRKTHMDYAVKYIKTMAVKRPETGQAGVRGTGGSDYAKHLGQHITDTRKSLYDIKGSNTPQTPSAAAGGTSAAAAGSVSPRSGMLSPAMTARRQHSTVSSNVHLT